MITLFVIILSFMHRLIQHGYSITGIEILYGAGQHMDRNAISAAGRNKQYRQYAISAAGWNKQYRQYAISAAGWRKHKGGSEIHCRPVLNNIGDRDSIISSKDPIQV